MGYEPSQTPRTVLMGLLAGFVLIFMVYLLARPNNAAEFTRELRACATERGIREIEWRPMHGFHNFNIGREFVAKTPGERVVLSCALQETSAEISIRDQGQAEQDPAIEIWYGENLFERDVVVYVPPSGS